MLTSLRFIKSVPVPAGTFRQFPPVPVPAGSYNIGSGAPLVRSYLISRFDIGEQTGHKADPQKVSTDMRNAMDEQNNRLFTRDEWLTKTQIKGFFIPFTATRRRKQCSGKEVDFEYKELV